MIRLCTPKMILGLSLIGISFNVHAQKDATFDWMMQFGNGRGSQGDQSFAIKTYDANGNVYVGGSFVGFLNLVDYNNKPVQISAIKDSDAFIAKFDKNKNLIWVKNYGGLGNEQVFGLTIDKNENVYMTGWFNKDISFVGKSDTTKLASVPADPNDFLGAVDAFVAKVDKNGDFKWVQHIGGANESRGNGIAADGSGNVFVGGFYNGLTDFTVTGTPNTLPSTGWGANFFLTKYDTDGKFIWAKTGNGTAEEQVNSVTVDAGDNVYIGGDYMGSVDLSLGANTGIITGGGNGFVAKVDNNGQYIWGTSVGQGGSSYVNSVAVDKSENVVTTGYFRGSVDFGFSGKDTFTSAGQDIYLSKYDKAGSLTWAKRIGGSQDDQGAAVAFDKMGDLYVTGIFQGKADFNPSGNVADTFYMSAATSPDFTGTGIRYNNNIFISKLNGIGDFVWAKGIIGDGWAYSKGINIEVGEKNDIYTTGFFDGTLDFNTNEAIADSLMVTSEGRGFNVFIHKMNQCLPEFKTLNGDYCSSYTYEGVVYEQSGKYEVKFANQYGCDSTIVLELVIHHMDKPVISIDHNFILGTARRYQTYQWFKDGNAIANANDSTFKINENGMYFVVVSDENNCSDTSERYNVSNVPTNIGDAGSLGDRINIYPNPTFNTITIQSAAQTTVVVLDMMGSRVLSQKINSDVAKIDFTSLASGFYLVQVLDKNNVILTNKKIIKK